MWKRLKVKVIGSSSSFSSSRKPRLNRGSVTTSTCDDDEEEETLPDLDLDLSKDDDPDIVKDSRKMSFPYLDKCSCGSPGFGGKEGFRKTESLVTEINRRNEGERRESFETARNEYTLFDNRKRPTTTTTTMMTTTTNTVSSSSSSSLVNTTTTTTTGYKGVFRSGNEDKGRCGSSSKESKEVGARTRNAIQRSSVGIEDSESEEEEQGEEEKKEENEREPEEVEGLSSPQIELEIGREMGVGGQRDSGGSEDYTSLAFDVNYVKVSPPKMTRRNKSNEQKKPNRGSRLAMTSPDDVRPQPEVDRQRSCRSVLPPSADRVVESPAMMTSRPKKPEAVSATIHETWSHKKQFHSSSFSSPSSHATEYISLQDLQNRMNIPVINHSKTEVDVAPQYPVPRQTLTPVDPVDQPGDSVTLIQDGDSSVLEFTFTVRLENDVIRRMRPEDAGGSNSGSPVVSGSVNILKSDMKPLVTVGLRSVSVDGDTATRSSRDLDGTGNEAFSAEATSRNHCVADTTCDRSRTRPEMKPDAERSRTRSENNANDDDDDGCCWSEAVKTVTWSVDRSRANPDWTGNRTPSIRKQQTLADFMSSQQQQQQQQHHTKITTVAIVHKPADFDESKSKSEAEVTSSRGSTPVVSPSCGGGGGGGGSHRVTRTSTRRLVPATEKEPELTHMSWDEVMTEARALGIPLQRPGSGTTRRLDRQASVDDPKTSWTCPGCAQDDAAPGGRPGGTPENRTNAAKKASPFKDKFKFQNLFFSRRSKGDDDGVGGKSPRDQAAFSSKHINSSSSSSKGCHTIPARSGTGIDDSKRCIREASGSKKTASPPGRIQSPFKMLSFSGTSGHRRSGNSSNGAAAEGSRSGKDWNSQTAGKVASSWNGAEYHKDNTITKSITATTLSPKHKPGTSNDFLKSLEQLKACGWYWGPLGFDEAEVRLSGKPDGAFLVRDSSDDRYILSLSFNSQGTTHHTRIEHYRGMFSFYAQQANIHEAATIVDFIENAMRNSQDGKCLYYLRPRSPTRPPAPVQLLYPVSRFRDVPSMKQLAQAAILRHVRRERDVDRLPLSKADRGSLKRLNRLRRHDIR